MFLVRGTAWAPVAGVALLTLPHLYGAPQPVEHHSLAPASLAHDFVAAALVTSLVFWATLGSLSGFLLRRMGGIESLEARATPATGQATG